MLPSRDQIDVNLQKLFDAHLTFPKIISDIENYQNVIMRKLDHLKKGKIEQFIEASILSVDSKHSILYADNVTFKPKLEGIFKSARENNVPLLIKTNDEWLIYGSNQRGEWQFFKIVDENLIKKLVKRKLPFKKNTVMSFPDTSIHASFLREVLKSGHVYYSKYNEINNKYRYHEYLILIERLDVLKKRLHQFEVFEKNWLHGSNSLANNQLELIRNTIESIKEEAVFAKDKVEQTIDDLYSIFYDVVEVNNKMLFNSIVDCLDRVIRTSDRISKKMESWQTLVFSSPIFKLATLVGARFIPLTQSMNPWTHKEWPTDGNGFGYIHVMRWRDDVVKTGKYLNVIVNDAQKKQENPIETSDTFLKLLLCQSLSAARAQLTQLLAQFDTHSIYRLVVQKHNEHWGSSGIALGLRKLSTGEIEFFDPKNGLFIFPDNESFRIWFSEFLSPYFQNIGININIFKIGKQPSCSEPTIPVIQTFNETNCSTYNNALNKQNLISIIDDEIKNLESSIVCLPSKIINALEVLKIRINQADSHTTLAGIVQNWLSETPHNSSKPYREIIKGISIFGESSTSRLIANIVSNNEINSYRMMTLQKNIINNILLLVTTKKYPASLLFEKIKKICANETLSTADRISSIKSKVCKKKYTGGLFSGNINSDQDVKDQDIKSFCLLIKRLNQDNPLSLIKTSILLKDLTHTIEMENGRSHIQKNIKYKP